MRASLIASHRTMIDAPSASVNYPGRRESSGDKPPRGKTCSCCHAPCGHTCEASQFAGATAPSPVGNHFLAPGAPVTRYRHSGADNFGW